MVKGKLNIPPYRDAWLDSVNKLVVIYRRGNKTKEAFLERAKDSLKITNDEDFLKAYWKE